MVCELPQATSESATKRAALLSDMHLRNLHQKLLLKQRMDEISKKLEVYHHLPPVDVFAKLGCSLLPVSVHCNLFLTL